MRDHSKHIQVRKDEAVKIILDNCNFTAGTESVAISEAAGRILAEDILSLWDVPNCLTCRMDSVAVRWDDFADGMPDTSSWERGVQWEFANTGVAMPQGFDTAIVIEHVILSDNDTKIAFDALPSGRYSGTSAPASKVKKGDLLVPSGTYITPNAAALIASGGHTEAEVLKRPKVAFLPTGNELIKAGGEIPAGRNIESNSYMMEHKIISWGGEPVIYDIIPDDKEALKGALYDASENADIVILNAGSSKGNDDWGIEMLEEAGTVFYHQTNHGPGHHSSFGVLNGTPVIGISGPPGGAAFTADFYVYPAVMKYLGRDPYPKKLKVRLGQEIRSPFSHKPEAGSAAVKGEDRPREGGEFHAVRQVKIIQADDGILEAYSVSSSMHPGLLEAEHADAYYIMPSWEGEPQPAKGDMIEVELRPEYIK